MAFTSGSAGSPPYPVGYEIVELDGKTYLSPLVTVRAIPTDWEVVDEEQTDYVLGDPGAKGDTLIGLVIIPATTSPGAVSVTDGGGDPVEVFAGGSESLAEAVPFRVELDLVSNVGGWTVTTGTGVSAIAIGRFTDKAPIITSLDAVTNLEGEKLAHELEADQSVTWSIVGGADSAQFEINSGVLRWDSDGTQDFETPADDDTDNVYLVTVRATNADGVLFAEQDISVTVTDDTEE